MLSELWDSTLNLYDRFEISPTVYDVIPLVEEESVEAINAALSGTDSELAAEIADVIVVALGLALARGLSYDDIHAGVKTVIAKNNAKTHATHKVNEAGKIARLKG